MDLFIKRAKYRLQMQKWRKNNPVRANELNKLHQYTWREKNQDLNRLRAKLGMRVLKMYRQLVKLSISEEI